MASRFDDLELNIQMGWLLDFYSSLLTAKQSEVLDMYYNDDLSLAEIAEMLGVSRQNIHDIISRASKKLLDYERKLNLVERRLNTNEKLYQAINMLEQCNVKNSEIEHVKIAIQEAIDEIEED